MEVALYPGTIEIRLGTATSLVEQLEKWNLTKNEIEIFQDDNTAINRAYLRDYLTESQTKSARAKLAKRIIRHIQTVIKERVANG